MTIKLHQRSTQGRTNLAHSGDIQGNQDMIFVFGSNTAGIHGAGAARFANLRYGAVMGVGEGPTGRSYALPTKGTTRHGGIGNTLSLRDIQHHVDVFIAYAKANPETQFQVTQVGCGLAGLKPEWIAPMFKDAPQNCFFDTAWLPFLLERDPPYEFWGSC